MTRAELERRLVDLDREIELRRTAIWLADQERETLRHELRRLIHISNSQSDKGTT